MSVQSFYAIISARRSVRRYCDEPVSKDVINRVLMAGTWASSAHNAQPWRFVLIEGNKKQQLAEAMGREYREDLERNGKPPQKIESIIAASVERFSSAPVLLLVCLTMEPMEVYPDRDRQQAEYLMGVQSVAAAIQNLLLSIHAEGLGACWYCAPLFCPEVVRQTLNLATDWHPQALITIGVPAEVPNPPPRIPLEKIVSHIT